MELIKAGLALFLILGLCGWGSFPMQSDSVTTSGTSYGYISPITYGLDADSPDAPDGTEGSLSANSTTNTMVTMSENGTADAIKVYFGASNPCTGWTVGIYTESSGDPASRIDISSEETSTLTGQWSGWISLNNNVSLSSGSSYFLAIGTNSDNAVYVGRGSATNHYKRTDSVYMPATISSINYTNPALAVGIILRYTK